MSSGRSVRRYGPVAILFSILLLQPCGWAAPPARRVVIAFPGLNERSGVLFVAKERGFFDEYGLDSQIVQVRSGPVALSALAAEEFARLKIEDMIDDRIIRKLESERFGSRSPFTRLPSLGNCGIVFLKSEIRFSF